MVVHRSKTKVVKVITTLPLRNDRESETRNRELTALREAMAELNLRSATIVTRHEDERIRSKGTVIHVVPIWRFLLSQPDSAE